jgi:hypothetical protein
MDVVLADPAPSRPPTLKISPAPRDYEMTPTRMRHHNPELSDRTYEDQRYRAIGLNLVVAAIVLCNTVYLGSLLGTERIAR